MLSNYAFTDVADAGMSRTLHVAAAAAHPAFVAHAAAQAWGGAVAITPQRKRRNATATGASVDRGPI